MNHSGSSERHRLWAFYVAVIVILSSRFAAAQFPVGQLPSPNTSATSGTASASAPTPQTGEVMVVEVKIEGQSGITPPGKLPSLATRAGTPFDQATINDDVRTLARTRKFVESEIKPRYQYVQGGLRVTFHVLERPIIYAIKFIHADKIGESTLKTECGLKKGDALDQHQIEEARRKLEQYYHEHAFPNAYVKVVKGTEPTDREVIFSINEGPKLTYWNTEFIGNTIVSGGRLKTQIESKPGLLMVFGGYVDRNKIAADQEKLEVYYRGLGFFYSRVGHFIEFDDKGWATLTFVIHEGPRFKIRSVKTSGNVKFTEQELISQTKMKPGDFFDQAALQADETAIRDVYGGQGHIFCEIEVEPHLSANSSDIDLEYKIDEGSVYRVGNIKVDITGDDPHTSQRTILNRLSLRPGDIVDTRLLRTDERRIKASGLFNNDPSKGAAPRIAIDLPGGKDGEKQLAANKPKGQPRFQSPDGTETINLVLSRTDYDGIRKEKQSKRSAYRVDKRIAEETKRIQRHQEPLRQPQNSLNAPATPNIQQIYQLPSNQWNQSSPTNQQPTLNYPQPLHWQARFESKDEELKKIYGGVDNNAPNTTNDASQPRLSPITSTPAPQLPPLVRYQSPDTAWRNPQGNVAPAVHYSEGLPPDGYKPGPDGNHFYSPAATQQAIPQQYPVQPVQFYGPPSGVDPNGNSNAYFAPGQPAGSPSAGIQPDQYNAPSTISPNGMIANGVPQQPEAILPGTTDPNVFLNQPQEGTVDIRPVVSEGQTGRFMIGVGVNSNAGVVGNIVFDEQNFDIRRFPRSWDDLWSGHAWRGQGQRFRIEAAPGSQVSRYSISFQEPYLWDTPYSLSTSGSYYERGFRDWFEERVSGRFGLGFTIPYRPDISVYSRFRIENVNITQPRVPALPELAEVVGHNDIYGFALGLTYDTRDNPFLPTEGFYSKYEAEYVTGSFDYPRMSVELKKYWWLTQRADGSGRHILALGGDFAVTGPDTPIYENYFAGGFSTLRGFRFRGASPRKSDVIVGGQTQALGSLEYMFPLTADDALRGVLFTDFGTVEEDYTIRSENFRTSIGFGLRISVAALGPAPIALDFAFPVSEALGDQEQVFTFSAGLAR